MKNKFKIIFSIIGIISLYKIIQSYGFDVLKNEFKNSGLMLTFLILTFIPTLFCYSISWLLATNHHRMSGNMSRTKKVFLFAKFSAISIAWNNLTPFLKVGGEPLKYLMLSRYLNKRDAVKSTINYNIIHLLATALSFIIGAIILCLAYDLPTPMKYAAWGFVAFFILLLYLSVLIMRTKFTYLARFDEWYPLRLFIVNTSVITKRLTHYYRNHHRNFWLSILFDTAARFIEGITFYYGFMIIKHPISLLSSSVLDVARTLIDTIFFFIPYQVGSREEGVKFFMNKVLLINPSGFLTAVLFYRLVEIAWIVIGYSLWVSMSKSSKVSKV